MVMADLHVHTNYSKDGFEEISNMFKTAKEKGINCIAITDHNSVAGLKEAKVLAKKHRIILIPGVEISSADGDIIALGVEKNIPRGLSAEETIKKIHEFGGLAVAVHPYGNLLHGNILGDKVKQLKFDAIEAINGRCPMQNKKATDVAESFLIPKVAGSDAHISSEIGNAYTLVEGKTVKEILENIRRGRTEVRGKTISLKSIFGYAKVRTPSLIVEKLSKIFGKK